MIQTQLRPQPRQLPQSLWLRRVSEGADGSWPKAGGREGSGWFLCGDLPVSSAGGGAGAGRSTGCCLAQVWRVVGDPEPPCCRGLCGWHPGAVVAPHLLLAVPPLSCLDFRQDSCPFCPGRLPCLVTSELAVHCPWLPPSLVSDLTRARFLRRMRAFCTRELCRWVWGPLRPASQPSAPPSWSPCRSLAPRPLHHSVYDAGPGWSHTRLSRVSVACEIRDHISLLFACSVVKNDSLSPSWTVWGAGAAGRVDSVQPRCWRHRVLSGLPSPH